MNNKEIIEKLTEVLDEQFPKGKCKERGHALVLFAEVVHLLKLKNGKNNKGCN